MDTARDLFGMPVLPPRGMGRPRHMPTDDLRQQVRLMREGGATLPTIATALRISEPTLALHYRDQLGWRRPDLRVQKEEAMPVSSQAMASGAGRWARFENAMSKFSPDDREQVLVALDEVTRPMTVREIDKAFQLFGVGGSDRRLLVAALKSFDLVMVKPK
jgi:hypothetical protein